LVVERRDPAAAMVGFQDALRLLEPIGRPHFLEYACRSWIVWAAAQTDDHRLVLDAGRRLLVESAPARLSFAAYGALRACAISVALAGRPRDAARMLGASIAAGATAPALRHVAVRAEALVRSILGAQADNLLDEGRATPLFEAAALAVNAIDACLEGRIEDPADRRPA
jgi:hypothetical protein